MTNSETVEKRTTGAECVVCGWTEYEVREVTAVGERQDESAVGERYEHCRNCGETYDHEPDDEDGGRP